MFEDGDIDMLIELVIEEQAREMIDSMLIEAGVTEKTKALKGLEMRLYRIKAKVGG